MVNEKLINVFLTHASKDDLIRGINTILNHFKIDSEYEYENRVNNFVNIVGGDKVPTVEDINIDLLKENAETIIYKGELINKDSIKIVDIDPIDKNIKINYNRTDDGYNYSERLDYTKYLKTVK